MTADRRPTTMVWAHRGASAYAPENTLEAFALAREQGADGVELDVQRSADGHLVVIHDETVDRTSDGTGRVAELTLEQLRRLDVSRGHEAYRGTDGAPWMDGSVRVPTLPEVLDLLAPSGTVVNIELKNSVEPYPGLEAEVLGAVAAAGMGDRVVCSSFNHRSLALLRKLDPGMPLGVLYAQPLVRPWDYAAGFGASALHPGHWLVGPEEIGAAQAAGLAVNVWTVNDVERLDVLFAAGADAVITNVPDIAVDLQGV